jgi:hypothetical protein
VKTAKYESFIEAVSIYDVVLSTYSLGQDPL